MSCYNVERNCQDFHTGTFQFQQIIGDQLQTSRFLRTASLEVEYFNEKLTLRVFDGLTHVNVF